MNEAETKIIKKYFYNDGSGFHPFYNSDSRAWNIMMEELGVEK